MRSPGLALAVVPLALLTLALGTGCPPPPAPKLIKAPPRPGEEKPADGDRPQDGDKPGKSDKDGHEHDHDAPAEPAPITSEAIEAMRVKARETGIIEAFPHMKVFTREKRIEIEGVTSLKIGPQLELLACSPRGKSYESLLVWLCEPEHLHLACLFLGLEPTPQIEHFGQQGTLGKGQKVVIEVAWKDPKSGEEVRRRAEDILFDNSRDGAMRRVGWVFTGSRMIDVPQPPRWDKTKSVYAAQVTGTVAVTYHDPDAIFDTPLAEGGNNTLFVAWSERLPERHTPCTIHIRPWRDGDEVEPKDSLLPKGAQRPPGGGPPGGGGGGGPDDKPENPPEKPDQAPAPGGGGK